MMPRGSPKDRISVMRRLSLFAACLLTLLPVVANAQTSTRRTREERSVLVPTRTYQSSEERVAERLQRDEVPLLAKEPDVAPTPAFEAKPEPPLLPAAEVSTRRARPPVVPGRDLAPEPKPVPEPEVKPRAETRASACQRESDAHHRGRRLASRCVGPAVNHHWQGRRLSRPATEPDGTRWREHHRPRGASHVGGSGGWSCDRGPSSARRRVERRSDPVDLERRSNRSSQPRVSRLAVDPSQEHAV